MDSHHQEQLDAWIPGAVAEEEPVVSSHSHSHTLILAHALSLTDLQWAMPVLVVSCTQSIQPRVSTMYTLDPRPLQIQPPHPPHAPRRPTSHSSLPLKILSPSLACPPSPSSITSSSSAIPEPVSPLPTLQPHFLYSPPLSHFPFFSFSFPFFQHQRAHTLLSRSSEMDRSVPCGCVIGTVPCPQIHLCPPCSAVRVHVQSMPTSDS